MLALNELLAGVIGLMILCGLVMLATCGGWWLLMRDRDEFDKRVKGGQL